MKDLKDIEISTSSSVAESYNRLRTISPTTGFEARRTMEALLYVSQNGNEMLLEKIREEEKADDKNRDRITDTR